MNKKEALELIEENVDNYYALSLNKYPFSKDPSFIRAAYKLLLTAKAGNWRLLNQEELIKSDPNFAKYYKATQMSYGLVKEASIRKRMKLRVEDMP